MTVTTQTLWADNLPTAWQSKYLSRGPHGRPPKTKPWKLLGRQLDSRMHALLLIPRRSSQPKSSHLRVPRYLHSLQLCRRKPGRILHRSQQTLHSTTAPCVAVQIGVIEHSTLVPTVQGTMEREVRLDPAVPRSLHWGDGDGDSGGDGVMCWSDSRRTCVSARSGLHTQKCYIVDHLSHRCLDQKHMF